MTKNYKKWYKELSIRNQLCVSFVLNIGLWFIFSLLWDLLFKDQVISIHQVISIPYLFFRAIFMAFFWTIFHNWVKIKGVFSHKNE